MLNEIIQRVVQALAENGVSPVYSAFDAVSTEKKNKGIFTVVGVGAFETQSPIYSEYTVFIPFKAETDISVTAPENFSMEKLYTYFTENIEPVITQISGLNCNMKKLSFKHDSNINRFVLTAKIGVSGLNKVERSST